MSREDQIVDELKCVQNFLKNSGRKLADWEIKKNHKETEVDVLARNSKTDETLKLQVTRFNGAASKGPVNGLEHLVKVAQERIKEKEDHYGVKNTLDLILLLASYTDFPSGFDAGLKKRLARLKFESFKQIHIVCPSANWEIKA